MENSDPTVRTTGRRPPLARPSQVVILSRDPMYSVLLEMTIREYNFTPRLTAVLERVEQLSTTCPTVAWFIDLDGIDESVDAVASRAKGKAPDAKIVFLSSRFTRELAQECLKHQALALLVKPLNIPRLISSLNLLRQETELLEKDHVLPLTENQLETLEAPKKARKADVHPLLRTMKMSCPICGRNFEALSFKLWTIPVSDTDTDFCPICPGMMHPELYTVMVCTGCLFAHYVGKFPETKVPDGPRGHFLGPISTSERRQIAINLEFSGERTLLHGIKSFELAAFSARALKLRNFEKLAGEFFLKSSWLSRRMGHSIQEEQSQRKALECFRKVYLPYQTINGIFPGDNTILAKMDPGMDKLSPRGILVTGFLAGELARRLKMRRESQFYFDEIVKLPFFSRFTSLMSHISHVIRLAKKETGQS